MSTKLYQWFVHRMLGDLGSGSPTQLSTIWRPLEVEIHRQSSTELMRDPNRGIQLFITSVFPQAAAFGLSPDDLNEILDAISIEDIVTPDGGLMNTFGNLDRFEAARNWVSGVHSMIDVGDTIERELRSIRSDDDHQQLMRELMWLHEQTDQSGAVTEAAVGRFNEWVVNSDGAHPMLPLLGALMHIRSIDVEGGFFAGFIDKPQPRDETVPPDWLDELRYELRRSLDEDADRFVGDRDAAQRFHTLGRWLGQLAAHDDQFIEVCQEVQGAWPSRYPGRWIRLVELTEFPFVRRELNDIIERARASFTTISAQIIGKAVTSIGDVIEQQAEARAVAIDAGNVTDDVELDRVAWMDAMRRWLTRLIAAVGSPSMSEVLAEQLDAAHVDTIDDALAMAHGDVAFTGALRDLRRSRLDGALIEDICLTHNTKNAVSWAFDAGDLDELTAIGLRLDKLVDPSRPFATAVDEVAVEWDVVRLAHAHLSLIADEPDLVAGIRDSLQPCRADTSSAVALIGPTGELLAKCFDLLDRTLVDCDPDVSLSVHNHIVDLTNALDVDADPVEVADTIHDLVAELRDQLSGDDDHNGTLLDQLGAVVANDSGLIAGRVAAGFEALGRRAKISRQAVDLTTTLHLELMGTLDLVRPTGQDTPAEMALFGRICELFRDVDAPHPGGIGRALGRFSQDFEFWAGRSQQNLRKLGQRAATPLPSFITRSGHRTGPFEPVSDRLGYEHIANEAFHEVMRLAHCDFVRSLVESASSEGQRAAVDVIDRLCSNVTAHVAQIDGTSMWACPLATRAWAPIAATRHQSVLDELVAAIQDVQEAWFDAPGGLSDIGDRIQPQLAALAPSLAAQFAVIESASSNSTNSDTSSDNRSTVDGFLMERLPELIEVLQRHNAPAVPAPRFDQAYPLDFTFLNLHGDAELSNLVAHTMVLEIVNRSVDAVRLAEPKLPTSSTAGSQACHFVLRFRKGTLQPDLANVGIGDRPNDDWDIVGRQRLEDWDELFIKGPADLIESGHSRRLTLTQMQGAVGATHNTRVLFLYHGLTRDASDSAPLPLTGEREKRLTVEAVWPAERSDAPRLPVQASFVGSNVVTNDLMKPELGSGSDSELHVALTNVASGRSRPPIDFFDFAKGRHDDAQRMGATWRRSKVIVQIDHADDEYPDAAGWALGTRSEVAAITATLAGPDGERWEVAFTGQGSVAEWVFTPATRGQLAAWRSLRLKLGDVRSSLSSGPAEIRLRCENFGEFPDREFVLPVVKSTVHVGGKLTAEQNDPTRFSEDRNRMVGIGTTLPAAKLHVRSNAGTGLRVEHHGEGPGLRVEHHGQRPGVEDEGDAPFGAALDVDGDIEARADVRITGELTASGGVAGDLRVTGSVYSDGRVHDVVGEVMPVGTIIAWFGKVPSGPSDIEGLPPGWLPCDGRALPDLPEFKELKDLLWNVGLWHTPKLQGRTLIGGGTYRESGGIGKDKDGNDREDYTLDLNVGDSNGTAQHQLNEDEMPAHWHKGWGENVAGWPFGETPGAHMGENHGTDNDNPYFNSSTTGGSAPHNNMQPYLVVNYLIKH